MIAGCHRSKSAEVHIGGGVNGENLACSGAKTYSFTTEGQFKPGIDFYNSGGNEGQALMLQHFAADAQRENGRAVDRGQQLQLREHRADLRRGLAADAGMVAELLQRRISVTDNFTRRNVASVKAQIVGAIQNVATAMKNAGYSSSQYTIAGPGLPVADPQRIGIPLLAERLHAPDRRRLRLLEQGRELRQLDDAADDRRHGVRAPRRRRA